MSQERVSTAEVQGLITQARVADVSQDRTAAEAERPKLGISSQNKERLLSIFSPFLLLILWEVLVQAGLLDKRFFPAPSSIVGTFGSLLTSGELFRHLQASIARIIVGFLLGAIPALILGVIMGLSRWVRAFLSPMVAALYPIPKIAILPLVMLIFGLGEQSKWVIIAIGVFFLVLYNTMAGVMNIPNIYLDVGRNFGASKVQFFWTVALPGALPLIFTGIKLAAGVALLIIVAAEFVGAKTGIGYMIWQSWQTFSVETMYVGLVVISMLGYLVSLGLDELEHLLIPWRL
jgi:NitT/TauT family transport system permease protein